MTEPVTTLVTVLEVGQYNDDWPPENPDGFLAWWRAKLDLIPSEHRARAEVEIETDGYGDDYRPCLRISYSRRETAGERAMRLAREADRSAEEERRERVEYQRLRAKFGERP